MTAEPPPPSKLVADLLSKVKTPVRDLTYWWRDAIIYQIWPASFCDSNGDGIGDIPAIIAKLDYVKSLGVDTIWLSPHYQSPRVDEGYDISDYKAIHKPFGTMEDMDRLIKETKARGLRLILDLVINHTSDQHAWFEASRASKDTPETPNPLRDWYIWRPAKGVDAEGNRIPPNNWRNNFNGSAWTWDEKTQEYYLHLFCPEQPDLNWTNEETRRAMYKDAMLFWLEKGIDGFRIDTVNMYSKPMNFPDAPVTDPANQYQPAHMLYCNGPRMHEYVAEIGSILAHYDAMSVGELPCTPETEDVRRYVSLAQQKLNMVFQFDIVSVDNHPAQKFYLKEWTMKDFKDALVPWQTFIRGNDAWTTVFTENHDQPRSISRYCKDTPEWRTKAGKMLALMQCALSGTQFIYMGQEIGMINFPDTWPIEDYKDVDSSNYLRWVIENAHGDQAKIEEAKKKTNRIARDNARVPVQWTAGHQAGFTSGTPWMRVNDSYKEINVEVEEKDAQSILHFYRKCTALRVQHRELFGRGDFHELDYDNLKTFSFLKQVRSEGNGHVGSPKKAYVVCNFSTEEQPLELPNGYAVENAEVLLATEPDNERGKTLRGYEGRIYLFA